MQLAATLRPAAASSVVKKVYLGSWIESETDKSSESAAEPEGVENPNQRWLYTAYRRFQYTAKRCMRICASHGPLLEASLNTEMKNYISESRSTSKELTKVDAAGHGHGGNHRTSS